MGAELANQEADHSKCANYKQAILKGGSAERLVDPGVNKVPYFYHAVHE